MSSIRYQPHIDGLRAIAVILVILHHLGDWAGLSGGYVGVDVFFVISGFLITGIVRAELQAHRFSFGSFYRRRIIRLAPAYFSVLIATSVAALILMLPAELIVYARSVAASSLFLANFHMWQEVGGYFGAAAETTPLLHLWSLAVEEQFYLLWPMVILIGHKVVGQRWMLWLVLGATVVGTVVSDWGVTRFPAAGYYLLPTRFYELTAGAALTFLPATHAGRHVKTLLSTCGLAMVLYGALTYGKQTLFPGYASLAPVLGTILLLRYGADAGPIGALLSTPISTLIGRISYPAYLWHWPIIAFLHLNEVPISAPVGGSVLLGTFALAWITYKRIELPARKFLVIPAWKVAMGGAVAPIAASTAVAIGVVLLHGLPSRFPDSLNQKSAALLAYSNKARGRCNEGPPTAPLSVDDCVLGKPGGTVDFLLVGDSHANHFTGFLDEIGKAARMRGYDMTRSNTPFLPGVDRWSRRNGELDHHENFVPRNRYVQNLLTRERYQVIVLAGNYTGFAGGEIIKSGGLTGVDAFALGMKEAIKAAQTAAQRVIVLTTVPLLDAGLHDCGLRNLRFGSNVDCSLPLEAHLQASAAATEVFQKLKGQFPDVLWIDPALIMCDEMRCKSEIDELPLYKDSGHLNDMGSRLLAQKWLERFGNPLVAPKNQARSSESVN